MKITNPVLLAAWTFAIALFAGSITSCPAEDLYSAAITAKFNAQRSGTNHVCHRVNGEKECEDVEVNTIQSFPANNASLLNLLLGRSPLSPPPPNFTFAVSFGCDSPDKAQLVIFDRTTSTVVAVVADLTGFDLIHSGRVVCSGDDCEAVDTAFQGFITLSFRTLGTPGTNSINDGEVRLYAKGSLSRDGCITKAISSGSGKIDATAEGEEVELFVSNFTLVTGRKVGPLTPATRIPSGAVGWWKAEGNADDLILGNEGTLLNGTTFDTGMVGQAFSFDGTDDYVEVASSDALKFTGSFSIESWINYDDLTGDNGDVIVTKGLDTEAPGDWAISVSSNHKLRPHLNTGVWTYFDCDTTLDPHTWYHVAMVYDGSHLQGYVNGVLDGSVDVSGTPQATDQSMRIGAYAPINGTASKCFFAGRIDELTLYSRALSANEIKNIYDSGSEGKSAAQSASSATISTPVSSTLSGTTLGGYVDSTLSVSSATMVLRQSDAGQISAWQAILSTSARDATTLSTLDPNVAAWIRQAKEAPNREPPIILPPEP